LGIKYNCFIFILLTNTKEIMGYYSYFTFSVSEGNEIDDEQAVTELREENEYAKLALDDDGYPDGHLTWYDHEENLKEYSKKYPNTVFHLSVEGEENGDMAQKYFKNGKMQICKAEITFPDYDEALLT